GKLSAMGRLSWSRIAVASGQPHGSAGVPACGFWRRLAASSWRTRRETPHLRAGGDARALRDARMRLHLANCCHSLCQSRPIRRYSCGCRTSMKLKEFLGIALPILQAPMAGVQGSALAAAVCNAGGLGSLPCAMLSPEAMRKELSTLTSLTPRPYNVNFFCHIPAQPNP